ncbi:MAG: ABC transporter permease [Candidatus Rifleibacteriota bacterium]
MLSLRLAWRNIWRNPTRTLVQILVIAGSLFFVIWMENIAVGSYRKMVEESVKGGSGHLAFQHEDYLGQRRSEQVIATQKLLPEINRIKQVKDALPRLQLPGLLRSSRENVSAMVVGVDFEVETRVNTILESRRKTKGHLPTKKDNREVYLGEGIAKRLQLKVGNKLVFMFQNVDGELSSMLMRIAGLFKTGIGRIDNSMVFIDRQKLAEAFGAAGAVHEIAIILEDIEDIPLVREKLNHILSQTEVQDAVVLDWCQTMKQVADAIELDHANLKFMVFLLYVLVAIGTVNLLLMSVLERTREFGLLRALGFSATRIKRLIGVEALLTGMVGCAAGLAAGICVSFYSWYYGLDFSSMFGSQEVAGMLFEPVIHSAWSWQYMIGLTILMMIMVLLASIYPAKKALRGSPSDAMRKY